MNTKTKFKDNDNRKTIMKNLWLYNSVIFISLVSSVSVQAASLDTDFVTGETLTATRLNEVNSAVNDNNTRIGNLETTSSDTLSALTCAASEVAKFDGTDWACAADNDTVSSGDITAVTAGTGLSGGGTTGDVTINIDTATIQSRVSGTCPTGQSIRAINSNGTVTCEVDTDTDTTYTAGTGLTLSGTTFSITPGNNIVSVSSMGGIPRSSTFTVEQGSACSASIGRYRSDGGGNQFLTAPIQIPHNATVTGFTFIVCDNDASVGASSFLFRSDSVQMAFTGTSASEISNNLFVKTTNAISNSVIDNLNYSYFIFFPVNGTAGSNITPISAIVEYTLP